MNLLKALYNISSPTRQEKSMIEFVSQKLSELGVIFTVDKVGNIYATKGKSLTFPCLAAHLDEVHPVREKGYEVLLIRDEVIVGYNSGKREFQGIGADDKNGIWVCLKCLEKYDNLKCVFFVGEEQGCIGSNQADMAFFDDCRFVIQCDRKGNSDFISNIYGSSLCSHQFVKVVSPEQHGYKEIEGSQTDVQTLRRRGLRVSCANISCGYYYPHTPHEMTNIADLNKCLAFVQHIIEHCQEVYIHKVQQPRVMNDDTWPGFFHSFSSNSRSETKKDLTQQRYHRQYTDAMKQMEKFFAENPNLKLSVLRQYMPIISQP